MLFHKFQSPAPASNTGKIDGSKWNDDHALGPGATVVLAMPNWWFDGMNAWLGGFNMAAATMTMPYPGQYQSDPIDTSWITVADGCEFALTATVIYNPFEEGQLPIPAGFSARVFVDDAHMLHVVTSGSDGFAAPPAAPFGFKILIVGYVPSPEV